MQCTLILSLLLHITQHVVIRGYKYPINNFPFIHMNNTQFSDNSLLQSIHYYLPTVRICIGTPCQLFNLALNTNSKYTFISVESNKPLFKSPINLQTSTTMQIYPDNTIGIHVSFLYQHQVVTGKWVKDNMSLAPLLNNSPLDSPSANLQIVLVDENKQLTIEHSIDGFLGLFRAYQQSFINETQFSFIDKLQLSHKQFGIKLDREYNGEFYLDNEFDMNAIMNKCTPNLMHLSSNWKCFVSSIKINEMTIEVNKTAFFMSSNQFVSLPVSLEKNITALLSIESNGMCYSHGWEKILVCNREVDFSKLSPIEFIFESNAKLVIEWRNLFDLGKDEDGVEVYILKISFTSDAYLIIELGLPAFVNRIIVFDKDTNNIAFLPFDFSQNNNRISIQNTNKGINYLLCLVILILLIGICIYGKEIYNKVDLIAYR